MFLRSIAQDYPPRSTSRTSTIFCGVLAYWAIYQKVSPYIKTASRVYGPGSMFLDRTVDWLGYGLLLALIFFSLFTLSGVLGILVLLGYEIGVYLSTFHPLATFVTVVLCMIAFLAFSFIRSLAIAANNIILPD